MPYPIVGARQPGAIPAMQTGPVTGCLAQFVTFIANKPEESQSVKISILATI
jgi:hypothetical protein